MKNPILFSLLFFACTTFFAPELHAQEVPYTPFPTDNLIWSIWGYNVINGTQCGIHFTLEEDIILLDDNMLR